LTARNKHNINITTYNIAQGNSVKLSNTKLQIKQYTRIIFTAKMQKTDLREPYPPSAWPQPAPYPP